MRELPVPLNLRCVDEVVAELSPSTASCETKLASTAVMMAFPQGH